MREIKFRAWDEQCNEMHYNFEFVSSGNKGNDWIIFRSDRQKLSSKPHPFDNPYFRQQYKIMQFTGLKDINGKDIYEGDLVKVRWHDESEKIGQVQYNEPTTEYIINWEEEEEGGLWESMKEAKEIEIKGNIHQNPELLK